MTKNREQKHQSFFHKHRFLSALLTIVAVIVICFAALLGWLTVTEFRPEPVQPAISGPVTARQKLDQDTVKILTFNMGYGSLGKESDFVLDGGKGSGQQDPATVDKNMQGIRGILKAENADIVMVQEIDQESARTQDMNQLEYFSEALQGYQWSYAQNFVCPFVPFPLTSPFGRLDSGIATYSRYTVSQADRISLPVPFTWPVRTANLKRCLLLTRVPLQGRKEELVIMNFHLEAYDDGEGKRKQTEQLMSLMQNEVDKGNYVIAGGDFNQIFPEVETVVLPTSEWVPGNLEPLEGNWRYIYDDSTPTCRLLNQAYDPSDPLTQYYVIDGFIVSENIEVNSVKTLDEKFEYSDHNPVVMEVTLK